jgi:hypothetical protein
LEKRPGGFAGAPTATPAPTPTLQQRYDEIRLLHSKLDPKDSEAMAIYKQKVDEYNALRTAQSAAAQ